MHVAVTKEIIAHSRELLKDFDRPRTQVCPVALAIREAFGDGRAVSVSQWAVHVWGNSLLVWFPQEVCRWIETFDRNLPVAPIEFDLQL
jgi:hypothetical protein